MLRPKAAAAPTATEPAAPHAASFDTLGWRELASKAGRRLAT